MTRLNRRRLIALLAPLPLLAAAAYIAKTAPISAGLKMVIQVPAVCLWYLLLAVGIKSPIPALISCVGYWYLLLSLGFYALLCGRDRISKALLICVLATTALLLAMGYLLSGFNPD